MHTAPAFGRGRVSGSYARIPVERYCRVHLCGVWSGSRTLSGAASLRPFSTSRNRVHVSFLSFFFSFFLSFFTTWASLPPGLIAYGVWLWRLALIGCSFFCCLHPVVSRWNTLSNPNTEPQTNAISLADYPDSISVASARGAGLVHNVGVLRRSHGVK